MGWGVVRTGRGHSTEPRDGQQHFGELPRQNPLWTGEAAVNRGGAAGLGSEREGVLNLVRVSFNSSGYGDNTGAKVKVFVLMFAWAARVDQLSKHVLSEWS